MAIGCSFLNMHDVNNLELMDSISREETHNGWREADVPTQSGRPGRQSTRQVTDDYCGQTVRGARSLDRQSRQPSRSMKKQRSNDDQSVVQTTPRFTCPSRHRRSRSRHPLPELAHVWALSHWIASASENANCCTSTWSDPDGFALRGRRERLERDPKFMVASPETGTQHQTRRSFLGLLFSNPDFHDNTCTASLRVV
jgi:hypothetical protein